MISVEVYLQYLQTLLMMAWAYWSEQTVPNTPEDFMPIFSKPPDVFDLLLFFTDGICYPGGASSSQPVYPPSLIRVDYSSGEYEIHTFNNEGRHLIRTNLFHGEAFYAYNDLGRLVREPFRFLC